VLDAAEALAGQPYPALSGEGARALASDRTRIVVVGAGGWLGLATLELLHGLFGARFGDRVVCFGSAERALCLRGGLTVQQRPLGDLTDLPAAPTLVLHYAFLTQEKARAMTEQSYVAANAAISGAVLAALDRIGATGVFLPSSGAVHQIGEPSVEASKRLYGRLKLEDETQFARWAEVDGRRAVIARVFNLSGPYINKQSSYALACFIADALADRPIAIRANRPVFRSFVAINELVSLALGALTVTQPASAPFDTAGDQDYEMSEIALMVQRVLGRETGIDRPTIIDQAPDRYVGDGAAYRRLRDAARVAPVAFPDQIRQTACFMAG